MIRQARRHRRRPLSICPLADRLAERPHWPTEVVAVHRQVCHRLVHPPVLTETIRLPRLPRVVMPVGQVLPFDERRIDRPARRRPLQRPDHRLPGPHQHGGHDRHHAALPAFLVHRRVLHLRRELTLGNHRGTTGRAGRLGLLGNAIDVIDRRLVGRVFVAGEQDVLASLGAIIDLLEDLLRVLDRARARDDGQDQAMLGIVGDMVPPVPLVVIGRVGRVAILLLLVDEGPLLIELDLAGLRGKKPRVPRGPPWRALRPCGPVSSRCRGGPRRGVRSVGPRCLRPGVG
jgi:hypothetical protein